MAFTNRAKSQHGANAQRNLEALLINCKEKNQIASYDTNFKIGKPGYKNNKQFYAPFIITFSDGDQWILFSTTSLRTDRVKGQQWDSINIKNIRLQVKKSLLVYSDGVSKKELENFKKQNEKYLNKIEFTAIDEIVTHDALLELIEQKNLANFNQGKQKDVQGKNFEDRVRMTLSHPDNLEKWKSEDELHTGINYQLFSIIMYSLPFSKDEVKSIDASTSKKDIGRLPSGGNPKTDVLVTITMTDDSKKPITISCKRSEAKRVSVHQYTADSFADVLDPNNKELRELLLTFQENPSLKDFGKENEQLLTKALQPYNDKLSKWVLAGIGGSGDETTQCATHILTYSENDPLPAFYQIDEYIEKLKSLEIEEHFGTLFTWTYPSKQRGKYIQLKCKVLK